MSVAMAFRSWADGAVAGSIPDEARAFSFNLYEHSDSFAMELIGCPEYDADNEDWACREIFAYRDPLFELPHVVVGSKWQEGLATGVRLVKEYLRASGPGHRLYRAEAVVVGFVDGDLELVWANGKEQGCAP